MMGAASQYEFSPFAMALIEPLPYFRNHSEQQIWLAERIGDYALLENPTGKTSSRWLDHACFAVVK
jgi:hypothetical protein